MTNEILESEAPLDSEAAVSQTNTPERWHNDELRLVHLLLHSGKPERAFNVIRSRDFAHPLAGRIFEAALSIFRAGNELKPECVAIECAQRSRASESTSDSQAWHECESIVVGEMEQLPRDFPSQGIPSDEAAKLAEKIVGKRARRARATEPTPDEIKATSEAINEQIGKPTFADVPAHEILAPALQIGEKLAYDEFQLRELLYPSFWCVSLQTEAAHAERAAHYIGSNVLFSPELGFLHFQEKRGFWRQDDKDGTLTAAKLKALAPIVRHEAAALLRFAATLAAAGRDGDARAMSRAANDLLAHSKQIEKQSFLAGAAKFLAADCRAEISDFAPVAWRFAFANCVFDNGKWRPAKREDYLLHVSPVELNRLADRREWCALLNRITGGDADFARSLQDAAAYAVSGASSLRAILWLFGPRGTGKSTFAVLLQTLLGEAAATIDTALLQETSSRERLGAQIVFKRAAFVSEAGNKRIDAELLKTLSGSDHLSVRFLYREAFTAKSSHALVLAANDAPRTDAYDDALRERVLVLPFVHPLRDGEPLHFEGHKRLESARQDANSALLRGFAAWVAEGLERLFQTQEIFRAPAVEAATAKFWAKADPLTPFWETIAHDELRAGIVKSDLRQRYEAWCQREGARPFNRNQWTRACSEGRKLAEERRGLSRTSYWVL